MGLRCATCGLQTNPTATGTITMQFQDGVSRTGTLTLRIDVCADNLAISSVVATFDDQSGIIPERDFVFTSTVITNVTCDLVNNECRVGIVGMGLVTGEVTPRQFLLSFRDRPIDLLTAFNITGFVGNISPSNLTPDLTFFGCPPTP
jgi:hypothetical protein